jgi:hypothetical protein
MMAPGSLVVVQAQSIELVVGSEAIAVEELAMVAVAEGVVVVAPVRAFGGICSLSPMRGKENSWWRSQEHWGLGLLQVHRYMGRSMSHDFLSDVQRTESDMGHHLSVVE